MKPPSEYDTINAALEELKRERGDALPRIDSFRVRLDDDINDDPAVSLTIFLDHATADADWKPERIRELVHAAQEKIANSGIRRWVYVLVTRADKKRKAG